MKLLKLLFRDNRLPLSGIVLLSLCSAVLSVGVIAFINLKLIRLEGELATTLFSFLGLLALLLVCSGAGQVALHTLGHRFVYRLRRSLVEVRGSLEATNLAIPRAEAAMSEIKSKMDESELSFRSDAFKELNEVRTELQKITATSVAIEDKVTRTTVTSPVRGVIKQLKVNTIGGVVQPGSDMLEIVPLDDSLLIEAKVRPQDVAFLHPGQKAMVKFTAYDYTIYGGLKANLELISADTITDEEGNSFYLIQVRTDKSHLGNDQNPLLIIPGMVATVDIVTGEKSVLDYLLKPVLKARAEAMRER